MQPIYTDTTHNKISVIVIGQSNKTRFCMTPWQEGTAHIAGAAVWASWYILTFLCSARKNQDKKERWRYTQSWLSTDCLLMRNLAHIWNKLCMATTFTFNLKTCKSLFDSMIDGFDTQNSPSLALSFNSIISLISWLWLFCLFIVPYVLKSRCTYQWDLGHLSDVTIKLYLRIILY